MSLQADQDEKIERVLERDPNVTIFLKPIAAPAALGLAGFAGSTWITAAYVAKWWGNEQSPTIFFPFVAFWGGLGQFIAGLFGYAARDTLVTVVHVLWGSFWMSIDLLYLLVATGALPSHPIDEHFPELASWFVVLAFFTWSAVSLLPGTNVCIFSLRSDQNSKAFASSARDLILWGVLTTLAIGSTIAICLFAYGTGVGTGMKAAAYFWIISAILAWWRVTVYMIEEAFGKSAITKVFPIFRTPAEKGKPLVAPGFGEPGVKRGMPGLA